MESFFKWLFFTCLRLLFLLYFYSFFSTISDFLIFLIKNSFLGSSSFGIFFFNLWNSSFLKRWYMKYSYYKNMTGGEILLLVVRFDEVIMLWLFNFIWSCIRYVLMKFLNFCIKVSEKDLFHWIFLFFMLDELFYSFFYWEIYFFYLKFLLFRYYFLQRFSFFNKWYLTFFFFFEKCTAVIHYITRYKYICYVTFFFFKVFTLIMYYVYRCFLAISSVPTVFTEDICLPLLSDIREDFSANGYLSIKFWALAIYVTFWTSFVGISVLFFFYSLPSIVMDLLLILKSLLEFYYQVDIIELLILNIFMLPYIIFFSTIFFFLKYAVTYLSYFFNMGNLRNYINLYLFYFIFASSLHIWYTYVSFDVSEYILSGADVSFLNYSLIFKDFLEFLNSTAVIRYLQPIFLAAWDYVIFIKTFIIHIFVGK